MGEFGGEDLSEQRTLRIGGVATVFGAALLLGGTLLHPIYADFSDSATALQEFASSETWFSSHLGQLVGVLFVVGGLVALYALIARRSSRSLARLGMAGAIASAGVFAALQAVEGIALKRMADAWLQAPAAEKTAIFHATEAVRQLGMGLTSVVGVLFGITVLIYGASIVQSNVLPKWLGWFAVLAGLGTAVGGMAMAHTDLSWLAAGIGLPSQLLVMLWLLFVGSLMWRRSGLV